MYATYRCLFSVALVFLFAQTHLIASTDSTKISCKIHRLEYFTVSFSGVQDVVKETEWEKEYKMDSSGFAIHTLQIQEPTLLRLTYDYRYFEAYLIPGDSLHLDFDGQTYPTTIDFSGRGKEHNLYLHAYREQFLAQSRKNVIKTMCQLPPLDFHKTIDEITTQKWAFYQNYDAKKRAAFSPTFAQFAESEIAYWRSYFLMFYYDEHLSLLSGEKYYIPDAYFDFLDDTKVNNDAAFIQPFYRKFLRLYHDFRIANLDFPHGLASRQLSIITQNADIQLFDGVECAHSVTNLDKNEEVLLLDKLTFPSQDDGTPVAYRLKVKRNNGQKGWIKTEGVVIEQNKSINANPLFINAFEVNTYLDLIHGMVKFVTIKLLSDQDDKIQNYFMHLKLTERLVLLNTITPENYDYPNEKVLYAAPFTKIRSNRGIMGWVSTSGIQLQWRKTILTEMLSKAEAKSQTLFNNLDYFFAGKALYYLDALDIRERLAFEGKLAVKKNYDAFMNSAMDVSLLASVKDIFQNEDKRFYVDSANIKIQKRMVSTRNVSLNAPPSNFRLAHIEDQYAASALAYKQNKALKILTPTVISREIKPIKFPDVTYTILPAVISGKNRINRNYELQLLVYPDLINLNSRTIPIQTVKGDNFFKGKNFRLEVPIIEPIFGVLISNQDSIPVYLQSGDEIELLSGNLGETQIECKGKSAANLKYLQFIKKNMIDWDKQMTDAQGLSTSEFRFLADKIKKEKLEKLVSFSEYTKLTPQFLRIIEIDIDYWHGFQLMNFAQKNKNRTFANNYYDFFDNLVVQNDFALPSEYYRKFVRIYLEEKMRKENKTSIGEEDIARTSFGEKTLKFLEASSLSKELEAGVDNKKVEIAQSFVEDNAYPTLNEMLKTAYKKRLAQEEGADAPPFTLLKADGKKAKLEDFKGKIIYLEFWDSQCADWIKNAKLLKKRHKDFKDKNIVFLYVNLDESQQKWKKIIRKRKPKGTQLFQSDTDIYNSRIDEAFSVGALPASALIDDKGKIIVSPAQKMDIETTLNKARAILH